jgi:hypothetical protein
MARWPLRGRLSLALILPVVVALFVSACTSGGGATPAAEITPAAGQLASTSTSPSSPSPVAEQGTPSAGSPGFVQSDTTPTPGGAGNVEVSPGEVALGEVILTLSVEGAQPMYDASKQAPTPSGNADQQKDQNKPKGLAVLGGMALQLTNNYDPSQSPPADQANQMVRHVALQVKDKASGQLVPHVVVSMDLLKDGRPVLQDQQLVPMVQSGGTVSQMHYGNNVKFPGPGDYQVFVRMQPSPLLGQGSAGAAQFNVSFK